MLATTLLSVFALAVAAAVGYACRTNRAVLALLTLTPTTLAFCWAVVLRRQLAAVANTLLVVALIVMPLHLLLVAYWPPAGVSVAMVSAIAVAVLLLALTTLRLLHVPASVAVACGYAALATVNLLLNHGDVTSRVALYRWLFLSFHAIAAAAIVLGLVRRRKEAGEQDHFGARMGFVIATWAMTVSCLHLFIRSARAPVDGEYALGLGPWLLALGAVLLVSGLSFARSPGPRRKSPSRSFGIVLVSLAGLAALIGLLVAVRHTAPMLVNLGILLAVTAPLGVFYGHKGRTTFQALAAISVPLAGAYAAMALAWPQRESLDLGFLYLVVPPTAPVGLALGAIAVYLVGLTAVPKERHWTHSAAAVAGLALGTVAFLGLATAGGTAQLATTGSDSIVPIPALALMIAMVVLTLASAWRIHWQPAVYIAALGLLITVGQYASAPTDGPAWLLDAAVWVSFTGALLTLVGGGLTLLGRKHPLARFYSEGLLVMGLAATTLTALSTTAGTSSWQALLSGDMLFLLTALAVALLVCAIRFRQEDLFGFFCFVVLVAVLLAFALGWGVREDAYLYRTQTVGLAVGVLLAAASWLLAHWLRGREGYDRFGAAAYVVAFATAMTALGMMPLARDLVWRGRDLVAMALILLFIRPHVRHPATGYAVAAAVIAAVFQFVASRYGALPYAMHAASLVAAGALAVSLVLAAHLLRHILLAVTHASDKEARHRSRPFTVVGMAIAVALTAYLAVQTALAYHVAWSGERPLAWLTGTFDPRAGLIAWFGILLAFLVSIWLFRHSARTFGFYLVGIAATISLGPVLFTDGESLTAYLIYAVSGYGAIHMMVYLAERPYMAMLSRSCDLYKDERHASTGIFTASAVSCFAGGLVAAFHIHTLAALIMLSLLTAVFFVWSFGQRRAEFIYPTVVFSLGALLSIWHNVEGPGPWTPDRLTINALVFAVGAPLWMAVGAWLNRRGGPIALLAPPARQMSVLSALAALAFLIALAVSPLYADPLWQPDNAADRMTLGPLCGAVLVAYFLWAAASFRATVLVYLAELSLLALAVFLATRIPGVWESRLVTRYGCVMAAAASLAALGLGHALERRRRVLYGRPIFYSAVFLLPVLALAGIIATAALGDYVPAAEASFGLAITLLLGSLIRARRTLLAAAAVATALGLAVWGLDGSFGWTGEAAGRWAMAAALLLAASVRSALTLRRP